MIEFKDVSKRFGKFDVLRHIDLVLKPNQCIALIGPNACGKTTLIKSVLGLVIPTSGDILIRGKSIRGQYQYRDRIGYMPQKARYPDNMQIGQVIEMMKDIRKANQPFDEELLYEFKLPEILHKRMNTLSGGTLQKVSATLAFMFNPDILILDEPTAGLDPLAAEILKEKIVLEHQKGKLVIITSHLLNELDDLVTHLIMMQDGAIRLQEEVQTLKSSTHTKSLSKAITHILRHDIPA